MNTAVIFDIKHFAVHDGNGIRTTVFFKGCSLKCRWCHNPESVLPEKEISFYPDKCVGCKKCETLCRCNSFKDGRHMFFREGCDLCGKCTAVCPAEAFKIIGRTVTVDDILPELYADKMFYDTSGGGVTLSGGECLLQSGFCSELLKVLKENGINTAVDTCGFVQEKAFRETVPYTDIYLYDLKAADSKVHKMCTGYGNELILKNLKYIDGLGAKTEIRYPVVPGMNDKEAGEIAETVSGLKHCTGLRILPYHSSVLKYGAVGKFSETFPIPNKELIEEICSVFSSKGINVIK